MTTPSDEVTPSSVRRFGHVLVGNARRARRGFYAPRAVGAPTTTRQAEVLNTAVIAAPTGEEGVLIGRDRLSRAMVAHDAFTAYQRKKVSSPNVLAIGVVGSGKSSLLKTVYVVRPLILTKRRVVVIDKKPQGGEGEYAELTRQVSGREPNRFTLDEDTTRINVMDGTVLAGGGPAVQSQLLVAMAEQSNNDRPLNTWERKALRWGQRNVLAAAENGRTGQLEDLLPWLSRAADAIPDAHPVNRQQMEEAGLTVRFMFERLLGEELGRLFTGDTSSSLHLSGSLTSFDISQLPDDGPAVAMVMSVARMWLLGRLRADRGWATNFVVEEGWGLVDGPGGRMVQATSKLARGLGVSTIAALHQPADVPKDSPAMALIREAQTVHLFRQNRVPDEEACVQLFGLDPGSQHTLRNLTDGHHLLKIGARPEIYVEHVRSDFEIALTDTDQAMTLGQGR
ncbi:hypothetical protein [Jannaschia sp. R86511]|uniref:hypothetical protein n=1 Tax=Jannaschia sp. R86511 TaxID=3093853 RepID=UPI0036D2B224